MGRCASAARVCQSASSDGAPTPRPCQLNNGRVGAAARTAAITRGSPAAAATMRMARRRVSEAPVADFDWSGEWPKPAWAIFRKARIFDPLRILHHRNTWNGVAQFSLRHPGSLDRPRTALIFIILDLAIQALKTLRPRWSFVGSFALTGHQRSHR